MVKLTLEQRIARLENFVSRKSVKNESVNLSRDVFRWYVNNVDMYNFSRTYDYIDFLKGLAMYGDEDTAERCMEDLGFDVDDIDNEDTLIEISELLAKYASKDLKRSKGLPRIMPAR